MEIPCRRAGALAAEPEMTKRRPWWPWVIGAVVALVVVLGSVAYRKYYWVRGDYLILRWDGIGVMRLDFAGGWNFPFLQQTHNSGSDGPIYYPTWGNAWGHKSYTVGLPGGPTKTYHDYLSLYREPGADHYILFTNDLVAWGVWKFPIGTLEGLGSTMSLTDDPQLPKFLTAHQRALSSTAVGIYLLHLEAVRRGDLSEADNWRQQIDTIHELPEVVAEFSAMMDQDRLAFSPEEVAIRQQWYARAPGLDVVFAYAATVEEIKRAWHEFKVASADRSLPDPVFPSFHVVTFFSQFHSSAAATAFVAELKDEIKSGDPGRVREAYRKVLTPIRWGRRPHAQLGSLENWHVTLVMEVLNAGIVDVRLSAPEIEAWWM